MLRPSAAAPKSSHSVQSVVGAPPQARAYFPRKTSKYAANLPISTVYDPPPLW